MHLGEESGCLRRLVQSRGSDDSAGRCFEGLAGAKPRAQVKVVARTDRSWSDERFLAEGGEFEDAVFKDLVDLAGGNEIWAREVLENVLQGLKQL